MVNSRWSRYFKNSSSYQRKFKLESEYREWTQNPDKKTCVELLPAVYTWSADTAGREIWGNEQQFSRNNSPTRYEVSKITSQCETFWRILVCCPSEQLDQNMSGVPYFPRAESMHAIAVDEKSGCISEAFRWAEALLESPAHSQFPLATVSYTT